MVQVNSDIWVATNVGAYRLTLPSGNLQRFVDPDMAAAGEIYELDYYDDNLWFATSSGLLRLELPTGETRLFDQPSIRRYGHALAVNDTVAAVTSENGLTLIFHSVPRTISREFTTGDGLPSNHIYSLSLDGDYLWIGSDRGLTRFLWNDPDRID